LLRLAFIVLCYSFTSFVLLPFMFPFWYALFVCNSCGFLFCGWGLLFLCAQCGHVSLVVLFLCLAVLVLWICRMFVVAFCFKCMFFVLFYFHFYCLLPAFFVGFYYSVFFWHCFFFGIKFLLRFLFSFFCFLFLVFFLFLLFAIYLLCLSVFNFCFWLLFFLYNQPDLARRIHWCVASRHHNSTCSNTSAMVQSPNSKSVAVCNAHFDESSKLVVFMTSSRNHYSNCRYVMSEF
jgi:hypothetical protein